MKNTKFKTIYTKTLGFISITLLVISFLLSYSSLSGFSYNTKEFTFEFINTKDMSVSNITEKKYPIGNTFFNFFNSEKSNDTITAIPMTTPGKQSSLEVQIPEQNLPTWRLPTETGYITDRVRVGHVAIDIGSKRGQTEIIYPIANGVISAIYRDSWGAKIIMVNHEINGVSYASQYVHLHSYASGLYIGKNVTTNDALGLMGTTGYSTGIHLHLSVVDCALGDSTCPSVNSYLKYLSKRHKQGFNGLPSLINVPSNWTSR